MTTLQCKWQKLLDSHIGGTDVEAETPILWPRDAKSWLIGKDPDAGKDWRQEEKGTAEDEVVGWHQRHNGHGFGWTPGVGDGQGGLACCGSWGHKELDTTEHLNWTEVVGWSSLVGRQPLQIRWEWSMSLDHEFWRWSSTSSTLAVCLDCSRTERGSGDRAWSTFSFLFFWKYMRLYVHCSIIYHSQDMEATQILINRWKDKEDVVQIYNGILPSH